MKVIVSTELKDIFNSFVVVDSFERVKELKDVGTLILHKCKETDFDAGVCISELHNTGSIIQFVYINENPSAVLRMVVTGIKGYYTADEFYLEDEEELLLLLEDLGASDADENKELPAQPALEVVTDFVGAFARNEKRINAPVYLEQVRGAINELSTLSQQQSTQLTTMGLSAISIFENASKVIQHMDENRKALSEKLDQLEREQAEAISPKTAFSSSIMYFAPYKYIGNAKVLLIREYAHCRYLTSFILGYLHHLRYELNLKAKLVFVYQKGAGVSAKYSEYPEINQTSMTMASLYDNEIVTTNNPKKEVMRDLLNTSNDIIVVIDRLYGSQDIVTGRVSKVNAVSGFSDVKRYKLKPFDTIFSVTSQREQLFTLSNIRNYPREVDARKSAYLHCMAEHYRILDQRAGVAKEE